MNDAVGSFAGFTLDSIFMQGPDGLMYRGHRTASGEPVLLKVPAMPEEWEEAARFRERFLARARGVIGLRHPSILGVLETGHDEASGMPYIAYEAADGKDLRELTARGRRVADTDIALVGAAVAEALDHAHAAGFVHGSITPASIIVLADGAAKLVGFGIEPLPGSPTDMRGHAVGSGSYAAPEQIIGGVVDGRADLFALGLVLFEAVTGQHPFLATPPRDARDRIVADEAPLPNKIRPETPGGFNAILFKLLQKDPAKRPAHGAEVAQSLRALHERLLHPPKPVAPPALAGAAPTVPAAARTAVGSKRFSPVAAAAIGAAVVLAIVVALLTLRAPRPSAPQAPPPAPTVAPAEVERRVADIEAALRAEDFQRAENLLAELRRDAALDERALDLGQRTRDLKDAKADRLYEEGIRLARQEKWQEARQRFIAVLALDSGYVDAQDRLDELSERRTAPPAAGALTRPSEPPAIHQRQAPTAAPQRLLHLVFRSPPARGVGRRAGARRPPPPAPVAAAAAARAAGPLGTVQKTFEMPQGSRQVLVSLVNERGNILGEQTFVLKFEPGREHRVTIEMATARSMPRFTAAELR